MRFLILGLMLARPRSLYDLHGQFAAGLSHIYAASYGSIHRALRQLHEAGDIDVVDAPGTARNKKQYRATAQGRRSWVDWMKQPNSTEDSEASMLARVLLLDQLDSRRDRREVLRALHERAVAELDALRAVEEPEARYPWAAREYGVRTSEGAVTWLEELMGAER